MTRPPNEEKKCVRKRFLLLLGWANLLALPTCGSLANNQAQSAADNKSGVYMAAMGRSVKSGGAFFYNNGAWFKNREIRADRDEIGSS